MHIFKASVFSIFLVCGACASAFHPIFNQHQNRNITVDWPSFEKLFKKTVDTVVNTKLDILYKLSRYVNVTSDCQTSLIDTVMAFRNLKAWAFYMVDATGKFPSGVLDGTIMDMGGFEECLRIRVNDSSNKEAFRGQHCMIGYQTPLLAPLTHKTPKGQTYLEAYGQPPDWFVDAISKTGGYYRKAAMWLGTCVPSTCSEADVLQITSLIAKPFGLQIKIAGCQVDEPMIWSTSAFVAVCILCFFVGLCLLGTAVDVTLRCVNGHKKSSETTHLLIKVLRAFSILSNTEQLFTIKSGDDTLGCFHGIRFFSATWIILGHTYFFTDKWKYLKYSHVFELDNKFSYYLPAAVLENFTIPVGSFFFMSGFLLVFATWRRLEKSAGNLNVVMFFIHKYWRMTPALGLFIAMFLAMPLIGSGPLWHSALDSSLKACREHWWTHLLYINNWWGSEDYCLIHTWYLPVLMQFHIIGIVILLLFFRWPVVGTSLGLFLAIGSCIITALITIWNDFPMPLPSIIKDLDMMEQYNTKIYIKPYCHTPSYLIGMAVAYIIIKYKDKKISWGYQVLGWILAISGALSAVYGIYVPAENLGVRAFYLSSHRIGWGIGVGWLAFACITGNGGIINRILSWKAFVPLGQLSYLVYLVHPLVMMYRTASLRERIYYGHDQHVFEFLTYTVISFFVAFIGYVSVEKPFLILDAVFFKCGTSDNHKKQKDKASVTVPSVKAIEP